MQPYMMTKKAYGQYVRDLFHAKSIVVEWDEIQVDDVIVDKTGQYRCYSIVSIPPKRGYMVAEHTHTGAEVRMNRKAFEGHKLFKLPPRLVALAFLEHEASVKQAIEAGDGLQHWERQAGHEPKIVIPAEVKFDYPELFTPMPEEWDAFRKSRVLESLRRYSETYFGSPFRPANIAAAYIAEREADIAKAKSLPIGPEGFTQEQYREQTIAGYQRDIENNQWILKHIETTIGLEAGGINISEEA